MKILIVIAGIVFLSTCACDESVAGTDYLLTPDQVNRNVEEARNGDSEAMKRLAFHFGLTGDVLLSQNYLSKCINMGNPDCLAEKSDSYFAKYIDIRTLYKEKKKYLLLAIRFNHKALIEANKDDLKKIEGYQNQGRMLNLELNKLLNEDAAI